MWTPDPARKPSDSQVRSYVTKTHFLAISCISTSPPTAVSPTTFRLHLDNYYLPVVETHETLHTDPLRIWHTSPLKTCFCEIET